MPSFGTVGNKKKMAVVAMAHYSKYVPFILIPTINVTKTPINWQWPETSDYTGEYRGPLPWRGVAFFFHPGSSGSLLRVIHIPIAIAMLLLEL